MTKTDHLCGLLVSAMLSIPAFLACGSDDGGGGTGDTENDASTTGGSGGAAPDGASSGGTSGRGGSGGGTSGAGGASGAGSGGMMMDPYECLARQEDPNPGGTATAGADCCNGLGTCTPRADISDESQRASLGHSDCTAMPDLACAPKASSAPSDGGALPSCHIAFDSQMYEGRCMPDCFLLGDPAAASLTIGDCEPIDGVNVRCAPCYDPSSGDSTGACEQDGDMPTEAAPEPFAPCGALSDSGAVPSLGTCLPTVLVEMSGGDPSSLPQDVCASGDLCVPTSRVEDVNSCFEKCTSIVGPGACVPTYVVEFNSPGVAAALGQITCQAGETCTPCLDPNLNYAPTGACSN